MKHENEILYTFDAQDGIVQENAEIHKTTDLEMLTIELNITDSEATGRKIVGWKPCYRFSYQTYKGTGFEEENEEIEFNGIKCTFQKERLNSKFYYLKPVKDIFVPIYEPIEE
jgi:hypothetical protein